MGEIGLVRPSREGDQFHYHWAARQCLKLLDLHGVLVAVTVEGPSAKEAPQVPITEGEEIIDVGLYYGAEDLSAATAVHYVQLKHSTLQTDIPWTSSGLERTINGFARRFSQLMDRASAGETSADYRFQFVTNRPVSPTVMTALNELASGQGPTDPKLADQLRGYAGLPCAATDAFFRTFSIESTVDGLWVQRNLLAEDARAYLPDYDYEAPVLLKELVTQKALAGAASDPSIRRHDVLRALKADTPDLFPAANEVKGAAEAFARAQETSILDTRYFRTRRGGPFATSSDVE